MPAALTDAGQRTGAQLEGEQIGERLSGPIVGENP
jgi:hypothetical protein